VGPAADGYFQVFRVPVTGGAPEQLTRDPSNKTQPAWSPDGSRLAYTVWSYTSTFWMIR
jgi:Tol biopolymer transport system component